MHKRIFNGLIILSILVLFSCQQNVKTTKEAEMPNIDETTIDKAIELVEQEYNVEKDDRITKGVKHIASLWRSSDGNKDEFITFCKDHYIYDEKELEEVFFKASNYFEVLWGNFGKISMELQRNMHQSDRTFHEIDAKFAGYSPSSHLESDLYKNKIAFYIALNFPPYSLEEKNSLGENWSSKEWAYARLGDVFTARVPASLKQAASQASTDAEMYISSYNIYMGHLLNNEGENLFSEEMVLLTHWNLRDEIKSNYANQENGLEKQEMIYSVMKHIINQTIPQEVINSGAYEWNPLENKVLKNGEDFDFTREPDDRYEALLNNFTSLKAMDAYYPELNTYIKRNFSGNMEIPQEEVEKIFDAFLSSPQTKKVAELIKQRLGRDLKPFDIWYNGFVATSGISEEKLNQITRKKYPTAQAMDNDLPNILKKLGWECERAEFIASKVDVDPARGSGHAMGASMRSENARLRTRIGKDGMDYKGYNIAVHEFGHNVEQTISMQDVDYYMINGVPNTSFTEALAFIFQKRDLELLGIDASNENKKHLEALETFWSVYEIMGVSMVDMKVWNWMYNHPEATKQELKEAVISIAKEVWNKYYSEAFGVKDEPILAIYSHMIAYPLYLSAYSFGHLIDFQIEQYLVGKNFSEEVDRIWSIGRLTPEVWMKKAVNEDLSIQPMLKAVDEAVENIQ